jgi:hypothetical protein
MHEIQVLIEERKSFSISMPKDARRTAAALRFLGILDGDRNTRPPVKKLWDALLLQHFIACIGLTEEASYNRRLERFDKYTNIIFEPSQ